MSIVGFVPVLAAGLAAVLLGYAWYSPFLFGTVWMRIAGITPEMAERGKKKMHLNALIALIGSMVIAWVMGYVGALLGAYDWFGAVELGFWCWIGFTAVPLLGMVLWEQKPLRFYFITAIYWLLAFVVMALIIVVGPQLMSGSSQYDTGSYDSSAAY